jgi:putative tryptophan/tyrosine transport system substrate-binding protein
VSYFTLRWWRNVAVERPPPMIMRAVTGSSDNRIRFQSAMCPGRMYLACTWPLSDLTDCNDDGIAEWCFLVRRRVAVIATTGGPPSAFAAKAATTTIPIVFSINEDPVRLGLVASLARPGGNLTGVNFFSAELVAKRLELLHELVPGAARVAVLVNPAVATTTATTLRDVEAAAPALGLQLKILNASTSGEINAAFAELARDRADALFVAGDAFFFIRRAQMVNLASRYAIIATYSTRDFPEAGGLMSYGTNLTDAFRQAGVYAGRILKGAKPAELPVVQSSKFEMVINHETARILGLTVPPALLSTADEVIE